MNIELSHSESASLLYKDDYANWSIEAARALVDYFENIEFDTGESVTLDIVAIRCDYYTHESIGSWLMEYTNCQTLEQAQCEAGIEVRFPVSADADADELHDKMIEFCCDRRTLIEIDGSEEIVVSAY